MSQAPRRRAALVLLAAAALLPAGVGTAQDKPKIAIKDIMEKAHKGNPALCAKVAGEKASKEEKQQLLLRVRVSWAAASS